MTVMLDKLPHVFYFHASADLYGSDYVLLELIREASKKYQVVVFLPRTGPLVDELLKYNVKVYVTKLAVLRREYFSAIGFMGFLMNLVGSAYFVYLMQKRINVVAFHTNTSAMWSGFFSAWMLRKRHYWQVMEIIEKPKFVSWVMSRVVGVFSDKIFCISDAVRLHFLKSNKGKEDKFVTIYHGVDRSVYDIDSIDKSKVRTALNLDVDTTIVGFAGRFNAWKGQEIFALAASNVLLNLNPAAKVHFLFMGSVYADQNKYLDELKTLLDSSEQLKTNSTLVGFQNDFQDWLAAMDILVLPSKLPEPNATVTIAAMTLGIPVVGTNIGGTIESVLDGHTDRKSVV